VSDIFKSHRSLTVCYKHSAQ